MTTEPTPIEDSIARTGRRYFRAVEPVYVGLCAEIDSRRGFPAGVGSDAVTRRSFPPPTRAQRAANGDVLVSVETWRFEPDDSIMINNAISNGLVLELTDIEYTELLPKSEDIY